MIHFGFTKLVVGDLDRCAAFYSEVFGLREQNRVHDEIAGRPIDEILFQATAPGGGTFVLLRFADMTSTGSSPTRASYVSSTSHHIPRPSHQK
jgi:catechol 2,3-dioxygenase-like lactoylglutathione lyase family enzyme